MRYKAFTLIEMAVVMAVIGIILGMALPHLRNMRDQGTIAKAKGELLSIQTAVESYYIHHDNTYPVLLSDLISAVPNIISYVPTDPFSNGGPYIYNLSENGNYYTLYSVGLGGNGSTSVDDAGVVSELNGASCIFVSNASEDLQP
ncbi:MAG: prepilin-type N-terminal cleavage/methylation domain-containing protein [Candidatus Omnitrophota bacterium]